MRTPIMYFLVIKQRRLWRHARTALRKRQIMAKNKAEMAAKPAGRMKNVYVFTSPHSLLNDVYLIEKLAPIRNVEPKFDSTRFEADKMPKIKWKNQSN